MNDRQMSLFGEPDPPKPEPPKKEPTPTPVPGDRDICENFHGQNDRSVDAWRSLRPTVLTKLRRRVLDAIKAAGTNGATVDELEMTLRMSHQSASARVSELKAAGHVKVSGAKRLTRYGKEADVIVTASPGDAKSKGRRRNVPPRPRRHIATLDKNRRRVYEAVRARGNKGATVDELEVALSMSHQTASATVTALKADGFLKSVVWQRQTRSGRWANVNIIKGQERTNDDTNSL